MIVYQAYLYKASVDHTSTEIFDRENWTFIGAQVSNNGISVAEQTLPNTEGITADIPYGTTFATQQDVFNFLIDYNRWLELEGWVFDDYREDTGEHSTWRASGKEFLAWSIETREAGDFIALSPAGLQVKFEAEHGAIQSVEQIVNGVYALLERTAQRILPRDTDVSRNDQTLTITPNDEDIGIYSARIYLKELEHIVLFNNTTIFNDLVYDPLFNTRQPRLKLIGVKTRNWDGRLTAPGFIVETAFDEFNAVDSDIYTNFEKTASDFEHMYDIETSVDNPVLRDHARHITGYQTRGYLESLLPDPDVQFQFYQGMIQQKGAPDSMDKLLRVEGIAGNQTLDIFEEWAFRLGRFGATETRPSIELQLDRSEIRNNPQLVQFGTQGPQNIGKDLQFDDTIHVMQDDVRWLRKPQDPAQQNVFALRNHYGDTKLDYPSAGYVKLDEVDYTSFTRTDLDTVYSQALVDNNPFEVGKTLWVYDDGLGEFIVYKMVDTGAQLQHVADGVNTTITLTSAIDVTDDDYIVIAGASKSIPNLEGVKQITTQYSVTGTTANPTTIGESININGTVIELTGTTVDEAVADITAAGIAGITASNINGDLRITGTSPLTLNAGVASETLISPIIDNGDSFFVNGSEVIIDGNPDNVGNIANAVFNTGDQLVINGRTIILDATTANDITEAANQINTEMTTAGIDVVASVDVIGTDDFLKLVSLTTIIDVTSDNTFGLKQTVQGRSDPSLTTDLQVIADAITNQSSATATVDGTNVVITSATLTLAPGTNTPDLLAKVNLVSGTFTSAWDDFGITTGLHTTVESLNIEQQTDTAYDWSTDQSNAPKILKLENTRFATTSERDASTIIWATNDLCYVDDVNGQWTTYIYNGTSWDTHRTEEYRLENRNIINAIIYDKRENKITQHLDIHDPRKGIVAQHAEKELWYKLEYDPAIYTNGDITQHNIIASKAWGPEEVGRVWWDLSTAKYLEYEMGDDEYRIANWGQLAPGSSVDVYEWVRSSTPPAEWVNNLGKPISEGRTSNDRYSGEVKGATEENIAWVERAEWNAKTNSTKTYYYYWVKNVETVPGVPFRKNSAATVTRFIENPTREGLLWFAPISKASFIVSNVYPFLVDEDTVIQINWNSGDTDVNVHTQWELMREGDQNSQPDDLLWSKMQDSLSAIDAAGNIVPDSTLSEVEILGTLFRPRQTWFSRLDEARTIFTTKVNDILATDAVVNNRIGWDNLLFDAEALPETSTYDFSVTSFSERDQLITDNLIVTGQKVFIEPTAEYNGRWVVQEYTNTVTALWTDFNTQDYKVEDYWDYVDYWAVGYSTTSTIAETYTDATSRAVAMVAGTTFKTGDLVKLADDGNGLWVVEVYDAPTNNWTIVGSENGTIEISSTFNTSTATYPARELRTIINALQVDILTKLEINELFFTMINYVHSEQSMVDWTFKTSYLYMTGLEEEIGQSVIQKTDKTEFVINYIEEVKPYHCKIRDFVQGKNLQIEEANVHATDFDKPMYYDPNTEEYRLLDPTNATDLNILETTAPFTDWYENWQAGDDNVRKIKSTIYYDRVKCWTDVPINGINLECMKIASNIVTSPETTKSLTLFSNLNSTATLQGFKIRVAPTGTVIYTGDDNTVSFETPQILTQLESLTVTKNSVVIYENGVALTTNPDDVFEVNGIGTAIIFTVPVATGESLEITVDENYNGVTPATITVTEGANEIIPTTVIPTSTSATEGLVDIALVDAITYDTDFKVTIDTGGATAGLVYVEMVYNLSVELEKFDSNTLDAADRIALFYNPASGMPKKELTLLNSNCRIKGSTIYSNDLEDDGVYRSKYTVKPLDGCDFRGTVIEGGDLLGTATPDLLLKDGYDDFQTASFQGKGANTWDTNAWDTEPYEEAANNEYELPWFAVNPLLVGVTVDDIAYTNGVEFTVPASPGNKLIFNPGFVPVFGAYIFVSDGQTFIESPTGASDTIVEGNALAQPH